MTSFSTQLLEASDKTWINILIVSLSPAVCKRMKNDPDMAKDYETVSVNGVLTCVTVCNSLHSHPKRCYNKGLCRVYRQLGPRCEWVPVVVTNSWVLPNNRIKPSELSFTSSPPPPGVKRSIPPGTWAATAASRYSGRRSSQASVWLLCACWPP